MLVVIAVFIGLVLLEPWTAPAQVAVATPSPSTSPSLRPSPPTVAEATPDVPAAAPMSYADWAGSLLPVRERDGWGIRLTVARQDSVDSGPVAQLWQRFVPGQPVRLNAEAGRLLAIGVTSPLRQPILDLRVWRLSHGRHTHVVTRSVTLPGQAVDRILLGPPAAEGGEAWPAGTYRIDVLTGQEIVRIPLELTGEVRPVGRVPRSGPPASNEGLARLLRGVDPGALGLALDSPGATTVTCLDGRPTGALAGAAAWLDPRRGRPERESCSRRALLDAPHALALLLPPGAALREASLVRLEPDHRPLGGGAILDVLPPPLWAGAENRMGGGEDRLALFRATEGGSWEEGTYRIDASWRDDTGDHTGSWLLDVYPRSEPAPPLLQAVRRASTVAGRWAVASGLSGDAARQRPGSVAADTHQLLRTCHGTMIMLPDAVVTAGYRGTAALGASIWRFFRDGSRVVQRAFVALDAVPGAVILAPVAGTVWEPGYYVIEIEPEPASSGEQPTPRSLVFCVGVYQRTGGVAVPVGAEDAAEFRQRDR